VAGFDGLEEVVCCVVDAGDYVGESFCVGGPENDDFVERVGRLEISVTLLA